MLSLEEGPAPAVFFADRRGRSCFIACLMSDLRVLYATFALREPQGLEPVETASEVPTGKALLISA